MIYKRKLHWHIDVTVSGIRYREALKTTDRRDAVAFEKKRVAEILAGKAASKSGRDFARKPFREAATVYVEDRRGRVAERTTQLEIEKLRPLKRVFGDKPLLRIKSEDITAYQQARQAKGVSGRTINMEVGIVRRMLKKAKRWNTVAEDVQMFPEHQREIGRALPVEQKKHLFEAASSKPDWMVAHCAAVLAASTTCRGAELKNLRWQDVNLFGRMMTVRRSKTEAGQRTIPLNGDALSAFARLWQRAQALRLDKPEYYVFPACENGRYDPTRHQKSWRSAWRSLRREAAKRAGREAARAALETGLGISQAKAVWKRAAEPLLSFRFHDLRHQSITELAEAGASDATLMAIAGHMSRRMLEHYSHVRMVIKRTALEKLESGLMGVSPDLVTEPTEPVSGMAN